MTVQVSSEMEQALRERADRLGVSVEDVVQQALSWFLTVDPELLDELAAWQEVGEEGLRLIEDMPE